MEPRLCFSLGDLDLRTRVKMYQIVLPPLKFELEPDIIFSILEKGDLASRDRVVGRDNKLDIGMAVLGGESEESFGDGLQILHLTPGTYHLSHHHPTPIQYRRKNLNIESLTSLPSSPRIPQYIWDENNSPPQSPNPPSQSPIIQPRNPSLITYEIERCRSHFYKDKKFHRNAILADQNNPYREIDMDEHWNRAKTTVSIHIRNSENDFPVSQGGAAIKKELMENFNTFSLSLQNDSVQFDETALKGEGFKFVFKGSGDVVHGEECSLTCCKRKPGTWWGSRKKLLACCRGVRFLEEIERQEDTLAEAILRWYEEGMGGSKILGIHDIRDPATMYIISAEYSASIPSIHLRCDEGSHCGFFKWRQDWEYKRNNAVKRTAAARHAFGDEGQRKYTKLFRPSEQVMSEKWRARRREQEKKAGRWTDGTLAMDRMWAEFYWATCGSDDPKNGPFPLSDKTREENYEKRGEQSEFSHFA